MTHGIELTNMDDMFTTMKPVMQPSAALHSMPVIGNNILRGCAFKATLHGMWFSESVHARGSMGG